MKTPLTTVLNRNQRFLILGLLTLVLVPALSGCGQEVAPVSTDSSDSEITEEKINQIIDEMPEVKSIIPLTDKFRKEQREYNLEKYKDNAEKASGFKIREYKDYWILENVEEGFGLRLPYDTAIASRSPEETNYLMIFRPNKDALTNMTLNCRSEMHIWENATFEKWLKGERKNYEIIEENQKNINNKIIFWDTAKDEFNAIYGTVTIQSNNYLYVFSNPFHKNDICKNTHKEIVNSYCPIL